MTLNVAFFVGSISGMATGFMLGIAFMVDFTRRHYILLRKEATE